MSDLNWTTNTSLVNSNMYLLNNIEMFNSDVVVFSFEKTEETLKAHKLFMAKRSEVFHTMFFGLLKEGETVKITDASIESFKSVIKFIYTDEADLNTEIVSEVMNLAKKYMIHSLEEMCICYIRDNLNPKIVGPLLESSINLHSDKLKEILIEYIGKNTTQIIKDDSFPNCSKVLLNAILNLDTCDCCEMDLILSTLLWAKQKCTDLKLDVIAANQRIVLEDNLYLIRFPTLKAPEFTTCIAENPGLLELDEVVAIYQWITLKAKADGLKFNINNRLFKDSNVFKFAHHGMNASPPIFGGTSVFSPQPLVQQPLTSQWNSFR